MTTEEVSVEKGLAFQKIAEAYAVLSILESRNSYDLMNKKQPNLLFGKDRQAFLDAQQRQEDGNKKRAGVQAGSYAEERKNWLAKERKRFNVDEIGRYRGGIVMIYSKVYLRSVEELEEENLSELLVNYMIH